MTAVVGARLVGRWALEEWIGGGGQADVYRARHVNSGVRAAVKVFHRSVWGDRAFRVRFHRECEALECLDHPNVVPILDRGEDDGRGYLAMRLAASGSLAERIASGPLAPPRALEILAGVAAALDSAHAAGLVHRDVTPGNILLDPSGAWLADFGIARRLDATLLTDDGRLIGTAGYMAPEVLAGGRAAPASDRYALAAVAFAALTGRPVFEADELAGVLYANAHRTPPRPSRVAPFLPRSLDHALERGLAKDPRQRPASAAGLIASLERALGCDGDATRRMTRVLELRRRRTIAPALVALAGLAALGGGALAVTGALSERPSSNVPSAIEIASVPLTVPAGGGRELAGRPVGAGDLPGDATAADAVAADVAGGVRVVALRGGWETLRASRARLNSSQFTLEPLRAGGRSIGILASPPLVTDIAGLASRWALVVIVNSSGSRALVIRGPQDAPARFAARLAGERSGAIAPVA